MFSLYFGIIFQTWALAELWSCHHPHEPNRLVPSRLYLYMPNYGGGGVLSYRNGAEPATVHDGKLQTFPWTSLAPVFWLNTAPP